MPAHNRQYLVWIGARTQPRGESRDLLAQEAAAQGSGDLGDRCLQHFGRRGQVRPAAAQADIRSVT